MLTFKTKMAGLLMKDNNGTDKNPNEPQQNYHIMKFAKHHLMSDCNWTRTHNHLVHKRTLNHLAKLVK